MLSNDHLELKPRSSFDGPTLEFDFPAFEIGVAEYEEGPTGCTVFHFPEGVTTVVDIRGGYPGTVGNGEWAHAICLAGGSFYGLEASFGAAAELFARRNYSTDLNKMPFVFGAIVYDYRQRDNTIFPDKALGRAAMKAARPGVFLQGRRGAGRCATCGWFVSEPAGQGGAFRQVGPTKVAVFTVINSMGVIVNREGQVVRGNLDPSTGRRYHMIEGIERKLAEKGQMEPRHGNTALTVFVTNQKISRDSLAQVGRQVHSSMARAIQPFHTIYDGDVLYAVTTNEVENRALNPSFLGTIASEVAWDAVLNAIGAG